MKRLLSLMLVLFCLFANAEAQESSNHFNWYEVFVYSFQDSNGDGIGDLQGVLQRLDYIQHMGYTGLWLMPVMPSPSYHKYDVVDFIAVDPQYGTIDDMKELVKACHERDIHIIIDLPINHTSTQHPWFKAAYQAILEGRYDDPYVDYYCFTQAGGSQMVALFDSGWFYEEQFSGGQMPDLNLDHPPVIQEIEQIMAFWLQECDVDGFRLDAVTSYFVSDTDKNIRFLNQIKAIAEKLKPGSYLVGEVWAGLDTIAAYYSSEIDSFFLFPMSQAEGYLVRSLFSRKGAASTFINYLQQVETAIPDDLWAPFLSNHDTGRVVPALQARKVPERVKFAHALLSMLPGNVFTYYGEEIGMVGSGDDPNKRLPMYWNDQNMTQLPPGVTKVEYVYPCVDEQMKDAHSLLNYLRQVNQVRLLYPAIALGTNNIVTVEPNTCLMQRNWNNEELYIAINFSAKETLGIELPDERLTIVADLEVGNDRVVCRENSIQIPPYAIVILKGSEGNHGAS